MVRTDNKKGSKGCKPSGVNTRFSNICKLCKPTLYSSKKINKLGKYTIPPKLPNIPNSIYHIGEYGGKFTVGGM